MDLFTEKRASRSGKAFASPAAVRCTRAAALVAGDAKGDGGTEG